MRILYLTNQIDVGGIETNIVRLASELVQRDHAMVVASRGGRLTGDLRKAGAMHHDIPWKGSLGGLLKPGIALARLIRERPPDVIHVFSAGMNLRLRVARLLGGRKVRRIPIIASVMGLMNSPDEPMWKIYLRAYLTTVGVKKIIVIAPSIHATLRKLPIPRRRLTLGDVVGVPVPDPSSDERSAARERLGLTDNDRAIMTIGRMDRSKSPELFLQAVSLLPDFPTGRVMAVMIGSGPLDREVAGLVDELNLADRVRLAGEIVGADRLLAAADVYVRPGVVEGFVGITVLEAQARAVPVVAFETEDVKLAVEHGTSGWLVERGDVKGLSEALEMLLGDPGKAVALGRGGLRAVRDRFSLDVVVEKLESIYLHVGSAY